MSVVTSLLATIGHGLVALLAAVLCLGFMPAPLWLRVVTLCLLVFALAVSLRDTVATP